MCIRVCVSIDTPSKRHIALQPHCCSNTENAVHVAPATYINEQVIACHVSAAKQFTIRAQLPCLRPVSFIMLTGNDICRTIVQFGAISEHPREQQQFRTFSSPVPPHTRSHQKASRLLFPKAADMDRVAVSSVVLHSSAESPPLLSLLLSHVLDVKGFKTQPKKAGPSCANLVPQKCVRHSTHR